MFFRSIQLLRVVAAIYITLFHISYWWNKNNTSSPHIFDFGFSAVDLFFVISGFVLYQSASQYLQGAKGSFNFFFKRLLRIYPLYWFILVICIACGIYKLSSVSVTEFLKIWLLFPNSRFFIYSTWTICYEIFFYLLLSIYVFNHKAKWLFFVLLLLSVLTILKKYSHIDISLKEIGIYNEFIFEFFLGIFVAKIFKQIPLWFALSLLISGFYFFFFPLIPQPEYGIVYGIPAAAILSGVTNLEYRKKINIPAWIVLTGNASYVLYLIHQPLVETIFPYIHFTPTINSTFYLAIILLVVAISVIIHLLIEKPMLEYLNNKLKKIIW
ncbi:MAG: acyltransferase [Bacteroidetes bacterium]|nr:acyltransferase [Bacteroidota bacterium]